MKFPWFENKDIGCAEAKDSANLHLFKAGYRPVTSESCFNTPNVLMKLTHLIMFFTDLAFLLWRWFGSLLPIDSRAGAPEDEDLDEPEPDSDSDEESDQMSC